MNISQSRACTWAKLPRDRVNPRNPAFLRHGAGIRTLDRRVEATCSSPPACRAGPACIARRAALSRSTSVRRYRAIVTVASPRLALPVDPGFRESDLTAGRACRRSPVYHHWRTSRRSPRSHRPLAFRYCRQSPGCHPRPLACRRLRVGVATASPTTHAKQTTRSKHSTGVTHVHSPRQEVN